MNRYGKIALSGVSLLAFAGTALAQDAAAEQGSAGGYSNEIIVSARRKEESAQDVPLVVQAVSAQQLQQLEIRQFEDVTRAIPGLQLVANTNGLGTTASLRGVNFDANASGAATTVEFYRNDAVITSGALFQAIYDIGQIEVLRGPQGTLRGRASPSGSITVTTRRPDLSEVGGYASGQLQENSRWNMNAAINVPVIADKLGVRVAGLVQENRGNQIVGRNLVTNAVDRDVWDKNRAIRASVRADPFDGVLVLDFNYEGISSKNRGYDQVESFNQVSSTALASPTTITADDREGIGAMARTKNSKYHIYNWQAQLNLFGQQLTYVGSKTSAEIHASAPQDAAALFGTAVSPTAPNNVASQFSDNETRQTTHEIRLQNSERIAGLFDYVVGAMRVDANSPTLLNRVNMVATGAAFPYTLTNVTYNGTYRFRGDREDSLFGNVTVHLGDRAEVSGGVRRIWFKANSGVRVGTYGSDLSTYVNSASSQRCFGYSDIAGCKPEKTATIYSASAKYNLTDDIMAYASYGTSWRPGNSVIGWRGTEVGSFVDKFLNLPDETSKSYELGLKTSWFDRRLRFNISGYSQKFNNYAYRLSSGVLALANTSSTAPLAAAFNFVAPVDTKVNGFESELSFDISPNFYIAATVAYADGKIKNGVFPCVDLDDNNVPDVTAPTAAQLYAETNGNQVDTCTGNASPSSNARWSGTFQAEYSRAVSDNAEAFLRGFLNWKGYSEGFTLNPYDQVKAHGLLDVFTGVRDPEGAWELQVYARNLLNTKRVLTRTDSPLSTTLTTGAVNSTRYMGITMTDPREFGISARFAFGSR